MVTDSPLRQPIRFQAYYAPCVSAVARSASSCFRYAISQRWPSCGQPREASAARQPDGFARVIAQQHAQDEPEDSFAVAVQLDVASPELFEWLADQRPGARAAVRGQPALGFAWRVTLLFDDEFAERAVVEVHQRLSEMPERAIDLG